jgi:hypothetical protein
MGLIDKWKKSREEKEKIKLVREEEMKKLELAREEKEREDTKNKELNEIWDKVKDFKTGYGTPEKDENFDYQKYKGYADYDGNFKHCAGWKEPSRRYKRKDPDE